MHCGPPLPHILNLPSTSDSSKGTHVGKHRIWEAFSLSCHSLSGSRHPGGAGIQQTGKNTKEMGEAILFRGSGLIHIPLKFFLHKKTCEISPINFLHIFKLSFPTGRVGPRKLKITSHKNKLRKSFETVCTHRKEHQRDSMQWGEQ